MEIEQALGEKLGQTFKAFFMLVFGLIFVMILGWKFAFICLAGYPIMFIGILTMLGCITNMKLSKMVDKVGGMVEQSVSMIKVITAYGGQKFELKLFSNFLQKQRNL